MKLMPALISTIAALSLGFVTSQVLAHEGEDHAGKTGAAAAGVPKDYPLKKCPVSGDSLSEHGKPIKVTAPDGTDVYLCCKDCLKDWKKDPAKYAKMVKDAKK